MKIAASFLSCKKIGPAIEKLTFTDVDLIHVDFIDKTLIDGRKISFRKLKKALKNTKKRLDVHLMVKNPKKYIQKFASLNAETIVFQVEAENDIEKNLELIRSFGIQCGLAISPTSELSRLRTYLDKVDVILVMGVEPGYGGQPFLENTISRIETLKRMIDERHLNVLISVDGGIDEEVAKRLKNVDIVISGSYITNQENYQQQIDRLRNAIR